MEKDSLTISSLIAIIMADIEIFLLMEEDQETLKKKKYTADEVKQQLFETAFKFGEILDGVGIDVDLPLFKVFNLYKMASNRYFSNKDFNDLRKRIIKQIETE